MMASASSSPLVLSLLLGGSVVFKVDILFLFSVIVATTYCVGLFFWLQKLDNCLFFKAIARGLTAIDSHLRSKDDSSRNDSLSTPQDSQVITSDDGDLEDGIHDHASVTSEGHYSASANGSHSAQGTSPSNTTTNSIPEESIINDAVPGDHPLSDAAGALLSLATDLEFDIADLTQSEADGMLLELRSLRSTVGSRVPLFMKQSVPPVDAFDPDAWYGEACLIDALMWLLRRRSTNRGKFQLDVLGSDLIQGNKEKSSTDHTAEDQEHGNEASQPEEQQQEMDLRSTSSCDQLRSILDSIPSLKSDILSSCGSTSATSLPVLTARGAILDVEHSLVHRLGDLSSSEVDALLVKLKDYREKTVKRRANAIVGNFWSGFEDVLEVKSLWDARIGLVDGVMAVIRQYNLSSKSPVYEMDDYSEIEIPSIFRLDNPRERRKSV